MCSAASSSVAGFVAVFFFCCFRFGLPASALSRMGCARTGAVMGWTETDKQVPRTIMSTKTINRALLSIHANRFECGHSVRVSFFFAVVAMLFIGFTKERVCGRRDHIYNFTLREWMFAFNDMANM